MAWSLTRGDKHAQKRTEAPRSLTGRARERQEDPERAGIRRGRKTVVRGSRRCNGSNWQRQSACLIPVGGLVFTTCRSVGGASRCHWSVVNQWTDLARPDDTRTRHITVSRAPMRRIPPPTKYRGITSNRASGYSGINQSTNKIWLRRWSRVLATIDWTEDPRLLSNYCLAAAANLHWLVKRR